MEEKIITSKITSKESHIISVVASLVVVCSLTLMFISMLQGDMGVFIVATIFSLVFTLIMFLRNVIGDFLNMGAKNE